MLNISRKVTCPECSGSNFWKGDPKPTDDLHCRYCSAFIAKYDDYISNLVRDEAARMLAQFVESDSEQDLATLKYALSHPEHRRASV
ncbi:hypothetical protein HIO72_16555 [Halomonas sp. PA5]|uniref:hypothetical protein n=1 Tax=Vreelandella populi TaxID=2498858 RepID=UPI0015993BAA|nr:hypothetical protein [Halomonas populi]QJQ96730.1 hypothetical protein HIO72_16555 [Halomonas sp. PA5]